MNENNFITHDYKKILNKFLSAGYETVGFDCKKLVGRQLLLRHDIDFSLEKAVEQAEVNNELNVSATFFLMPTTEHYNLLSKFGRRSVHRIKELRQHIGIHLDVTAYDDDLPVESLAKFELNYFVEILGEKPSAISFHRPIKQLQGYVGHIANLPHAYEPRFFNDIDYCSDSNGGFHFGSPLDRDSFANGQPMQLLTHPVWWMWQERMPAIQKLKFVLEQKQFALKSSFSHNCKLYSDFFLEKSFQGTQNE